MNELKLSTKSTQVSFLELEHLKFEFQNNKHIVSLTDAEGHKIIRGYGYSKLQALNDLHHNLI